ncbi:MAG: hypothetical protein K6C11_01355 [Bacilli bacterium]|nr:hypothetical protein [Bacilli bacterium]
MENFYARCTFRLLEGDKKRFATLDDFLFRCYQNLHYGGILLDDEHRYDELLTAIYNLSDDEYKEVYKNSRKIPYSLFASQYELLTQLIENKQFHKIMDVHEIYTRAKSAASRVVPHINSEDLHGTLNELNELTTKIKEDNADELLSIVYGRFNEYCKEYKDDEELKDFYKLTCDSLKDDVLEAIKHKVSIITEKIDSRAKKVLYHRNAYYNPQYNTYSTTVKKRR